MKIIEIPMSKHASNLNVSEAAFHTTQRQIDDHLVRMFTAYVAGEKQQPIIHKIPATPWQMAKERWFPKWALERWPVRYNKLVFTVKTVYPFLKTKLPATMHGERITVMVNDTPIGCFVEGTEGMTPMEVGEQKAQSFREQLHGFCERCHQPLDRHEQF